MYNYSETIKVFESRRLWELEEVAQKFNEQDIPVMLLKGAIDLAFSDNQPLASKRRNMKDMDFLITKSDWDPAELTLIKLGYEYIP